MRANRTKIIHALLTFLVLTLTSSCVEEYWPELNTDTNQLLVIDGRISNFPGPYTVKLSRSSSIQDGFNIPLSLAKVSIMENTGDSELLHEVAPGTYKTSVGGIQGIIGNAYKIRIETNAGKIYESEFETLMTPVEVDNVKVEESVKFAENSLETDQEGYQFYVSSKRGHDAKTYLFWEIEEVYEYHSDYKIIFLYKGGSLNEPTEYNPYGLSPTLNEDTLFHCWKYQNVADRFSYSTEYLSEPIVNNLPLHFIPFTDERLRQKYSILVKQYSMSEEAYTFMKTLEEQNSNQDNLFTSQPYQVRGNVFNVDDQTEAVLGYFMVAGGAAGERLLTRAPARVRWDMTLCRADTSALVIKNHIHSARTMDLPLYFTFVYFENPNNPMGEALEVTAYVNQDCLDCTSLGGTAIKPEFWDW
ncbi:MAG: DUF4249 domain-containing protein [Bacteroidales bacterium]|nr:DUF4249 domain-containing protein [Bacteroidales bacterium]